MAADPQGAAAPARPPKLMYHVPTSPFIEISPAAAFTPWEAVKMALLLPTVPLRIAVMVAAVIVVALLNSIAIHGCDLTKPLPPWRRRLVELSSQGSCGTILRCCGFWRPRIVGMHNWSKGRAMGAIGVFNHVSVLDSFVITWAFCAAGLTMDFTKRLPVLGAGIRALQNLYLPKEGSREAQKRSMVQLMRERARDTRMPPFVVAPEGTLSHGRCLLSFKTGAFVVGAPVVPILLKYQLAPHNPAWTIYTDWWWLLRLLCQFENRLEVQVLEPYTPSAAELADPALYAANVRKLMAHALGVPLVDQDRSHFLGLVNAGISVSLDGRSVLAPPGLLGPDGSFDISPFLPGSAYGGGGNGGNGGAKKQE